MITLDELKEYLKVSETDTTHDDLFRTAIGAAKRQINHICNQPIELTTLDYYIANQRTNMLYIPFNPVKSVNSMLYTVERPSAWITLDSSYYELVEMNRSYYIYNQFGFYYNYKINLTVGYTIVPDDVKSVAIEIAAYLVKNSDIFGEGRLGLASQNVHLPNGVSENTVYIDVTKRWREVLKHYRISL